MDQATVILVPVLRRPQNVEPLLQSIEQNTVHPYRLLFCCTSDDDAEIAAIQASRRFWTDYIVCGHRRPGDYARKINLGYRATSDPLIFLGADDLRFHPGWLEKAKSHLSDQIQVVGTNDLGNPRVIAGVHSTHSLLTRDYARVGTIDRPNMILHEGYDHDYTDDEFVQTAQYRGVWAFAKDSVVEHLHPHWNKGEWDDVYSIADQSLLPGRRLYVRRRHLWKRPQRAQGMRRR